MSKFKIGDRVRKINNEFLTAYHIGQELLVTGISGLGNYWVGTELGEKIVTAYESDLELIADTPKEITLNGATYVLKEDPKPEHEWKFGDIAMHCYGRVGFVIEEVDEDGDLYFRTETASFYCKPEQLTFLRRADLSV